MIESAGIQLYATNSKNSINPKTGPEARTMNDRVEKDYLPDIVSKMKKENLDDIVIETFRHYHNQALNGETGLIYDSDIQPVDLD